MSAIIVPYKPKHFTVQELVPPETIKLLGADKALTVMDSRILMTADLLRELFNAIMTINNYSSGGALRYRGYRPATYTEGAVHSQHRLGKAIDFNIEGYSEAQIRARILKEYKTNPAFKYIRGVELNTIGWVHVDVRDWDISQGLCLFSA